MTIFMDNILAEAGQETIEAIVIHSETGKIDNYFIKSPDRDIPIELCNVPLTVEQALPLLNYNYYDGYGSQDCHNVYVYTATRVIYVHEYDGSTWLESVPRNPPTATKENQS